MGSRDYLQQTHLTVTVVGRDGESAEQKGGLIGIDLRREIVSSLIMQCRSTKETETYCMVYTRAILAQSMKHFRYIV